MRHFWNAVACRSRWPGAAWLWSRSTYTLHDLVRLYGRTVPATTAGEQEEFRDRALGWYLAGAGSATVQSSPLVQLPEIRTRRPWTGLVNAVD